MFMQEQSHSWLRQGKLLHAGSALLYGALLKTGVATSFVLQKQYNLLKSKSSVLGASQNDLYVLA